MFNDDVLIYYKVAAGVVIVVLVMSFVTIQFGNHSRVRYTSWFKNTVNSLVDMAESAANRGDQDLDLVMSLSDYTTAVTIMDTLRSIVPDSELQDIAQINVQNFMQLLAERRTTVVQEIGPIASAPPTTTAR
jgi:hypothetical protein